MRARALLHAAFHEPDTRVFGVVQGAVWVLILLSVAFLVVEPFLAGDGAANQLLQRVDRVVLALFAVEILLRVASYRPPMLEVFKRRRVGQLRAHLLARLRYVARPIILIDILAVLALLPGLRGLRALRLLRLLQTSRVFQYRNPFAIVFQSLEESALLFALAFAVLGMSTVLGGLSFYFVEVRSNPAVESVGDGLWWALVTVTTIGFGDIVPVTLLGRLIAAMVMIAGMFTLALFAGIVGSSLVSGMLSIREEQFRMSDYVNHVVVCGYDESTHLLLAALSSELDLNETRVVFCDSHERPRELPPSFLWVQGNPTKESELDKVRLTHALAVVVSGERDISPQIADARTILITFTIRAFLQRRQRVVRQRHRPLYIVVEILDSENVDHAKAAGANEVIETRKIGYSMIAHAIRHHGTATTMSQVLMSGGHHVYIGHIPKAVEAPLSLGDLLIRLQLSKRGGLVIGLRTPEGREILNPPKSQMVHGGTLLIYLAPEMLLEPPT